MSLNEQMPVFVEPAPGPGRALVVQPPPPRPRPAPAADNLRKMFSVLRRRWLPFLAVMIFVIGAVAFYTIRQTPQFTATSTLLVNSRVLNVAAKDDDIVPVGTAEDKAVNSEIQILQSTEVAKRVIAALTSGPRPDLATALTKLPPAQARLNVLGAVQGRMKIDRPGGTNVLSIAFTTDDPVLAAQIANEFVSQYLAFKVNDRLSAARTADAGLRKELDAVRGRVEQAEASVAAYRRSHNLLSADGVTLTEQEQSLYKQQEAAAQTALAEERARLNTARSQMSRGSSGDDVGEALTSPVVNQLRGQRALVSAKLAQLEARYKPSHPEVVRARRELGDVDDAIKGEISRVVSNLEARVQVAQQKSSSASGVSGRSRGELASNAAASVGLNELERRADALRTNYAGMLQRQTAVASQAVVADVDARLLSAALIPERPSSPNRKLNLALGGLLAVLLAAAVIALLQFFDQTLVSSRQVEDALGVRHIVNVPSVKSIASRAEKGLSPIDFVVERPLSTLAESMRSLLLAIEKGDRASNTQVIGITSARPGEGKSTLAACLARVAAISGRRTLLIDGDIRRPSIAPMFGFSPTAGLVEVLAEKAKLKETLLRDERSGAWILPSLVQPFEHRSINSEENLQALMQRLASVFDLVIIDSAPALAAVESRLLMDLVDQAFMVVRWNHTHVPVVRSALTRLASVGVRLTGVIMTQVNMKAIASYAFDDVDHEYRSYAYPEA